MSRSRDLHDPTRRAAREAPGHDTFCHGADIGVRGRGPTAARAFEQAAVALTGVVTEPARVRPAEAVELECAAPDLEVLLVEWLNAVVYEMAVRRMLFGSFEVALTDTPDGPRLRATARGEPVDPPRHQPAVEVKGATFTELEVRQDEDGQWRAQCVVDV